MKWDGLEGKTLERHKVIYSGRDKYKRWVGIILDNKIAKALKDYWTISDYVLLIKLNGKPFNISIIQAYTPVIESSADDSETFYNELDLAELHCKSQDIIILGDFNAKVGSQRSEVIVGPQTWQNQWRRR